jgi:alkylated DNA repair dioxygenase AlkB
MSTRRTSPATRRSVRRATPPEGFRYRHDLIDPAEERVLADRFRALPLKEFEFQGYLARRRVVYYGWQYSYDSRSLAPAGEIPEFLLPLRERAAAFAELPAAELEQALVAEYSPGTPIGWHRDKPMFGDVVGVSLLSACTFRFRRLTGGAWERFSLTAEPRSAYLLRGPARTEWEHSIPEVEELRYSVTFRTLRRSDA